MASRKLIQLFSFVDHLGKDWFSPTNTFYQEGFGNGLDYAGSDAISKIPLLLHFDRDWAFLSQFPPTKWTSALYWRYNEGMLQASEARENHPRKHMNAIKDWVPEVVLKDAGGDKHVFTGIPGKGMYVGYNAMFTDYEKPVKLTPEFKGVDYGYRPLAKASDGPSIRDIDVLAKTPQDVKDYDGKKHYHADDYNDGRVGLDMSRPQRITPEFVDSLPDDDPLILKAGRGNADVGRKKLKEEPPHTLAGMPTMAYKTANKLMNLWIKAQGLGLLGQPIKAGDELPDPLTGGKLTVSSLAPPSTVTRYWTSFVGRNDAHRGVAWTTPNGQQVQGRRITLSVPIVKRMIYPWYTITAQGKRVDRKGGIVEMPLLMSTTLLPHVQMPPEQRQQFAKRQGKAEEAERGTDPILPKGANRANTEQEGAVGEISNLLNNWDLLSPEQMKHMKVNQRNQLHVLARQASRSEYDSKFNDPHAKSYYTIGWTANKANRGMFPHNLSKEQLRQVIEKYVPSLTVEAGEGIAYYMKLHLGHQDYQPSSRTGKKYQRNDITSNVLRMMQAALPDLTNTCAILLALRLNDPSMGIYDPAVGLTYLDQELINKPESAKARRKMFAFSFARDLAQASLMDSSYGTRRQRAKLAASGKGGRREINPGDNGAWDTGDQNADKRFADRERELGRDDAGRDPKNVWMTPDPENIARPGWLTPRIGNYADGYLQNRRNEIAAKAGPEYAVFINRAKTAMKRSVPIKEMLIGEKERELAGKIRDPQARREQAMRDVDATFQQELTRRFPDLYGSLDKKQWREVINAAANGKKYAVGDPDEEESSEQQEKVIADGGITQVQMNQLVEQNINFLNHLLKFGDGDIYGIVMDEDKNPVIGIIEDDISLEELAKHLKTPQTLKTFLEQALKIGRNAINDYFVKVWMALCAENRKPITLQQAIQQAQKLGYSPVEANAGKTPLPPKQPVPQIQAQPQVATAAKDVRDMADLHKPPSQGTDFPRKLNK